MSTLLDLIATLEALDIEEICAEAFNQNSDYSEQLNREQLDQGLLADGGKLPSYKVITQEIKRKKGQQTEPMNLEDTGDFRDGFVHQAQGTDIFYISTDSKFSMLSAIYGPQIMGLNHDSAVKLMPYNQKSVYVLLTTNTGWE